MSRYAEPMPLPRRLLWRVMPALGGPPERPRYASVARRVGPPLASTEDGGGAEAGAEEQPAGERRGAPPYLSALWSLGLLAMLVLPGVTSACGPVAQGAATTQGMQTSAMAAPRVSSVCGSLYVVRAGDTLTGIALRCGVPLLSLENANPWSDPLEIGRILLVPATAGPAPVPSSPVANTQPAMSAPATGGGTRYVVRAGDTLSAIALRFRTTVEVLARVNGLSNPDRLSAGQALLIPVAQ